MRSYTSILMAAVVGVMPWVGSRVGADVIDLKDGRTLSGSMSREGGSVIIQTENGGRVVAAPTDVVRVTLTSNVSVQDAAKTEWTRTAALIRQANDLPTIISLHQKFIEKFPQDEMSAGVRVSLVQYQKLAAQGGVKFRGRWMPAAQVQVTLRQWKDDAAPALALYSAGKLRPALEAAQGILNRDAGNPNAAAIAGLAAYRLNNLKTAEGCFAALAANDPSSALAENNLAVIQFQGGRQAESLGHYVKALQAKPENRLIADNIKEALNAYSGNMDAPPYKDLVRQFQQAEMRLEIVMGQKGLYRYGSSWVTAEQLGRLQTNLQNIRSAMAQLDARSQSVADGSNLDDQIRKVSDDYAATQASLDFLTSTTYSNGPDEGLQARQNAMAADLQKLGAKRSQLEAQRAALNASAPYIPAEGEKLKTALAAAQHAQFSGFQRIMDVGEDENPPAPAVISMPTPYVSSTPTVVVEQTIVPPAPVVNVINPYNQFATFGVSPWVPIVRPPRSHEHDHGDGNGQNTVPSTPIYPVTYPVAPVSPYTVTTQPKP